MPLFNTTVDVRFRFDRQGRLRIQMLDPATPGIRLLELYPRLIGSRVRQAERIFHRVFADQRQVPYFRKFADAFGLQIDPGADFELRVPRSGPLVVVANHPLNGIDGVAIAAVLGGPRPDLKLMLTTTFAEIPGMSDHAIFVNASSGPSARSRAAPLREAIAWLQAGHGLILFPAGQGSYLRHQDHPDPVDVEWQTGVATLLKRSQASVLPVFVYGRSSPTFLLTRRLFRPLSTLLLLREILIQAGRRIQLRVGEPITFKQIAAQGSPRKQVDFLRERTYALDDRISKRTLPPPKPRAPGAR